MIGHTNAGGGKSVGGKLTVNAPANTNVTAKLGSKSKVVNSGDGGSAVFKGLDQGSWNVSIANSDQTVTIPIPITITTDYFKSIAFFASKIVVTYPSGSTCTCTNGNTTYTASDTSGSYTFTVPRTGTWTVKCTNGSSMATQDVSITADGQSVSITLSYWNGELFDNGNQYTDYTGGWTGQSSSSPNLQASCGATPGTTLLIRTVNTVNLTNFNTLYFVGNGYGSNSGGQYDAVAGISTSTGTDNELATASFRDNNTYSINVSSLSGSYYIHFRTWASRGANISISKVWLA